MKQYVLFLTFFLFFHAFAPDLGAQVSVRRGGGARSEQSQSRKEKKDDSARKKESSEEAPVAKKKTGSPTTAQRRSNKKEKDTPTVDGMSVRQKAFSDYQAINKEFVPWQHVVYREINLEREVNASLYYPVEPQDGLVNFFTVLLRGACCGRVPIYEYLDGREVFQPKYKLEISTVLDKFQIPYEIHRAVRMLDPDTCVVQEQDIPSTEVLSYYIKERWEFDKSNSTYRPRILALCPILHRAGDFGGEPVRYPMFWVNFEDLRPDLRKHLIMSDGLNNTPRFTMEEFFNLQMYQGDLYKVQNLRGLSLMQQYPNPDTLRIMRRKIEAELRGFGDSIWVYEPDYEKLNAQNDSLKLAQRRARRQKDGKSDDTAEKRNRRTKEEVDMEAVEAEKEAKAEEIDQRVEDTGTAHSARRSIRQASSRHSARRRR